MKRRKIKRKAVPQQVRRSNFYFPIIHCVLEGTVIAVSSVPMKIKYKTGGRMVPTEKVDASHWTKEVSQFRVGYEIDFSKYEKGMEVRCPHCNSLVDFRLFPSSTPPKIEYENQ